MDKERILSKYPVSEVDEIWEKLKSDLSKKPSGNPTFVIHGGYGKKNMGDDAILGVIIERIRERFDEPEILVACHNSEEVEKLFPEVTACNFKSLKMLLFILRADVYVIGGGGIINVINTYSGYSKLRLLDLKGKFLFIAGFFAGIFGAKLIFYSIGATSIPDAGVGFLAKKVLDRADFLSVRDPLSRSNLKSIGVKRDFKVGFDPVTTLEPAPVERAEEIIENEGLPAPGKSVLLNLRYVLDPEIPEELMISRAADLCREIHKKELDTVFFPFGRHPEIIVENDLHLALSVDRELGENDFFHLIKGDYNPKEAMSLIGLYDILILERLHSVIMARMMGKDVIAICYDRKVSQFCEMSENPYNIELEDFEVEKTMNFLDELVET